MSTPSGRTAIIVAVIGLLGAVTVAVIQQWDSIFPGITADAPQAADTIPLEERPLYGVAVRIKYHAAAEGERELPAIRSALTRNGAEVESFVESNPRAIHSIEGGFCNGGQPWTITYMSKGYENIAHRVADVLLSCCERGWSVVPGECEGDDIYVLLD